MRNFSLDTLVLTLQTHRISFIQHSRYSFTIVGIVVFYVLTARSGVLRGCDVFN